MRTILASVAILALVALVAPQALAQQLEPQVRLVPSTDSIVLGPNQTSAVLSLTVRNLGPASGQVTLNAAPIDGWRFEFVEAPTFMLAREGERIVPLKISVADDSQNATGVAKITATIVESTTGRTPDQPITSDVALAYTAPAVPPPPPPPPGAPWGLIASITGLVLFVLFVIHTRAARLELSSSKLEVTPAGSGYVRVTIRNRWWPTRRIHVRVRDVPSPAVAALSLASVRLRPRESVSVPLLVKAPVHMPDGQLSLTVQTRVGFGPWISRRRVQLTFRGPVAPGTPLEPLAPILLAN